MNNLISILANSLPDIFDTFIDEFNSIEGGFAPPRRRSEIEDLDNFSTRYLNNNFYEENEFDINSDSDFQINNNIINNIHNLRLNLNFVLDARRRSESEEAVDELITELARNRLINSNIRNTLNAVSIIGQDITDFVLGYINDEVNMSENTLNAARVRGQGIDFEDVKVTLSEKEFNKLKKKKSSENEINLQCNICLDNLLACEAEEGGRSEIEDNLSGKESDDLVILNCNHIYHKECAYNWLVKYNSKCPTCRTDTRNF